MGAVVSPKAGELNSATSGLWKLMILDLVIGIFLP